MGLVELCKAAEQSVSLGSLDLSGNRFPPDAVSELVNLIQSNAFVNTLWLRGLCAHARSCVYLWFLAFPLWKTLLSPPLY